MLNKRCNKQRDKFLIIFFVLIIIYFFQPIKNVFETIKRETRIVRVNGLRKLDYHDNELRLLEEQQKGPGELGLSASLSKSLENEREEFYKVNGFNARLSDEIALNRSLKDIRHPLCKDRVYLAELPQAAVIIPFFNEHWSTLLRTAFSAYNRSPKHLLLEILLVDDASNKDFLKDKLDQYLAQHLPIARVIRLRERQGLIRARLEGAKQSVADVYIFLDSHTECTTNWLPPLLEPIAQQYRTVTCPFIDVIDFETFEYRAQDEGRRGAFDWDFYYKRLPVLPEDEKNMPDPFKSPIMAGGLFAISSKFFWELGGYDPGLDIWGGEQYELSFKIWQCHGQMVDVPCSRVGHIYKKFSPFPNPRKDDFLARNYRRVAEVWMDDYKKYLYMRRPEWLDINTGDISDQLEVRQRNKCKSFRWFIEEVAFDLVKHYPPIEPPDYANGTIQSLADPSLCLDSFQKGQLDRIDALNKCSASSDQLFHLTSFKDLRLLKTHICFDVPDLELSKAPVLLLACHKGLGNQMWNYDVETKQVRFGQYGSHCLDASIPNLEIFVAPCDTSPTQTWKWTYVNEERLARYKFLDPLQENV